MTGFQSNKTANGGMGYTMIDVLIFIPAVILLASSGRYICPAFFLGTSVLTLSTLYLVMRFDQLDNVLDKILRTESLDENISLLEYYIRVHGQVCVKSFRYNMVIKWYLLVAHYTFAGVLAMVIFTLIAAPVQSIYITVYLVLNIIVTASLAIIIGGSASIVHSTTVKSYHKLNLIFAAYAKFYDHKTRNQLFHLIESISSPNKPISFYCHDIFPFKKTSLIEVRYIYIDAAL